MHSRKGLLISKALSLSFDTSHHTCLPDTNVWHERINAYGKRCGSRVSYTFAFQELNNPMARQRSCVLYQLWSKMAVT